MNLSHYSISFDHPHRHFVNIDATFRGLSELSHVDLTLPTWCHGSYLIRDYAQHVFDVSAYSQEREKLKVEKISKTVWRIDTSNCNEFTFSYSVYCHDKGEITPRGSHVVDGLAFLHFPTLIVTMMERRHEPLTLKVRPPLDWKIYTGLSKPDEFGVSGSPSFQVDSYDTLLDTPLFAGNLYPYSFEVDGLPHHIVLNEPLKQLGIDSERFLVDISELIRANRKNFDHYPYDQYCFFLMIVENGGGGLEHHNSSVNIFTRDRMKFPTDEAPYDIKDYVLLLSLLAHEHFHSWNIKEFGPEALCCPDYTQEVDTGDIWTVEGFANYFEMRAILRGKLIDSSYYLKMYKELINNLEGIPGRRRDSLVESGENAWIRLYKAHENNVNTTVSYYLRGSLVCTLLDIEMLHRTEGKVGLSNLVDYLSHHCTFHTDDEKRKVGGYPSGYLQTVAEKLTESDFSEFFANYVNGNKDLPFDDIFALAGLDIKREKVIDYSLGLKFEKGNSPMKISQVLEDSLAWKSKLAPGDVVVAVDRRTVVPSTFEEIIRSLVDGKRENLEVHFFRNGLLHVEYVALDEVDHREKVKEICVNDEATDLMKAVRAAWLFEDVESCE